MSDSKTITALEIGTGKMQVFIGEVVDDKLLNFIGSGQAATEGVKKADIVDIRRAASQAQAAIVMAERSASAQIKSVCLGISGTHIKGFRNVGSANVSGADGVVRREDVERAKEDARTKSLAEGRSYIHRICCGYYVDDKFCTNPLGLSGRRVDAEYWMMHGDNDRIASAIHAVESFGIEVEHLVFSGIASALAVTSPQQKIDGVLCVDIGCGTSDYAYYRHGYIVQAGVIPIGGDHITNDLSFGIRLTRKNSERVKIHCGKANLSEDERGMQFWSLGDKQIGDKKIPLDAVNRIIRARLEELFLLLREDIQEYLTEDGIKEVVLTGGTSNLDGICELAAAVLERPCGKGRFDSSVGEKLRYQEYATALGLLEYARIEGAKISRKKSGWLGKTFGQLFNI